MNDPLIVGIGEILWDVLPEGKKLGGAPSNFAYHVSQLGLASCVASAIGGDALGQEAAGTLDGKRVTHLLQRVDFPTGTVQVELDARGVPRYDIRTGVAWDNIPYTDALDALAERTRAVCFGSLAQRSPVSRETIARFLDRMPDGGDRYRIFDINLRQDFYTKEVIERSLEKCNVLKINDEELVIVNRLFGYPGIDLQDTCRTLIARYGLRYLILTLGANGSYVFPQHGEASFCETPKVEVADTVGAGDSFTAGFCSALLRGKTTREAHRLAVDVSAYVCTQNGAMPVLPESLKKRLE